MSEPIAYGIDFGTTNSAVAVAYNDGVRLVKMGDSDLLPSLIYLHRNGNVQAGAEAVRQHLLTGSSRTRCGSCTINHCCQRDNSSGGCSDSRLIGGMKSYLCMTDFSTNSWGRNFTASGLVAVVLRRLKLEADDFTGSDVRRLVLGRPVRFVGAEAGSFAASQKVAIGNLVQAAYKAGFEEVELLEEPAAVMYSEMTSTKNMVAVDFGGGTFDVSVVRFEDGHGRVLALDGAEVGGERFDELLFDARVRPSLGLDDTYELQGQGPRPFPSWIASKMGTLSKLARLVEDRQVAGILRAYIHGAPNGKALRNAWSILYAGQAYAFIKAIEDAKVALSAAETASVVLRRPEPGPVDIEVPVTRVQLEEDIGGLINLCIQCTRDAVADAGMTIEDVCLVVRTGGSSQIPLFVNELDAMFGSEKVSERPPFTSVAAGLAKYAQSRHAEVSHGTAVEAQAADTPRRRGEEARVGGGSERDRQGESRRTTGDSSARRAEEPANAERPEGGRTGARGVAPSAARPAADAGKPKERGSLREFLRTLKRGS